MKKKTVDVCKNFTDGVAILALVFAAFLLFVAYSDFKPTDAAAHFYNIPLNAVFIGVAALFAFSFAVSVLTRFNPLPGLTVSAILFWYLMACFAEKQLGESPMVYIILGAVHFVGQIIYFCRFMPEHRSERDGLICGIISAVSALMTLAAYLLEKKVDIFSAGLFWPRVIFITFGVIGALAGLYAHPRVTKESLKRPPLIAILTGGGLSIVFLILEVAVF